MCAYGPFAVLVSCVLIPDSIADWNQRVNSNTPSSSFVCAAGAWDFVRGNQITRRILDAS